MDQLKNCPRCSHPGGIINCPVCFAEEHRLKWVPARMMTVYEIQAQDEMFPIPEGKDPRVEGFPIIDSDNFSTHDLFNMLENRLEVEALHNLADSLDSLHHRYTRTLEARSENEPRRSRYNPEYRDDSE